VVKLAVYGVVVACQHNIIVKAGTLHALKPAHNQTFVLETRSMTILLKILAVVLLMALHAMPVAAPASMTRMMGRTFVNP
jgi:hypothetical protein